MKLTTKQKAAILLVILFLIGCVSIIVLNTSTNILETETATFKEVTDSVYTNGLFIREEALITNNTTQGVISYVDEGGVKVSAGGTVANIYSAEETVAAIQELERLDKEIEELEKVKAESLNTTQGLDSITKQLQQSTFDILKSINEKNFNTALDNRRQLLAVINQRKVITGEQIDYSAALQELKSKRDSLKGSSNDVIATVKSEKAGYFTSATDGYEGVYNYKSVADTTLYDYEKFIELEANTVPDNVIGKVITSLDWYIVCPVSADEIMRLGSRTKIEIVLPYASTEKIPVEVVSINQEDRDSNGVVVLKCKNMSAELAGLRNETVRIDVTTYEGIRIPKSAIYTDTITTTYKDENDQKQTKTEEVQGVYTVYGGELKFKQIYLLYSGTDFVLCEELNNDNKDALVDGSTIKLYDRIVVKGTDLYDGKIVTEFT